MNNHVILTRTQITDGLILCNLSKWYGNPMCSNRRVALDGLTIEVAGGESLGLLGVNGAGKSTVFDILMGKQLVTSGTAVIDGNKVTSDIRQVSYVICAVRRVPTVMEKHGKAWKNILSWKLMEKSWKIGQKNKVMEILKSQGISLLLITNHAREVPIIPYLQVYCSDLAMGGFRFMF